jgi:ankyrin repeat protein
LVPIKLLLHIVAGRHYKRLQKGAIKLEKLLAIGADINAAAHSGRTALQAAAEGGHQAIVEKLLAVGADVNAASKHRGRTALQAAAGRGIKREKLLGCRC